MSVVERIEAMPEDGMLPVSYLKEAVEEVRREAIALAATEEGTIQMYEEMATRHLCEDPTQTYEPVDGTELAARDDRDANRDTGRGVESWMDGPSGIGKAMSSDNGAQSPGRTRPDAEA